jgi:transposase
VGSVPAGARGDLTDREWQMLEPLLPRGRKPGGPSKWTKRQLIDGIRWRVRTGAPWRDVPGRYGTWNASTACSGPGSGPGVGADPR